MPANRKVKKRQENRIERLERLTKKDKPDWAKKGKAKK